MFLTGQAEIERACDQLFARSEKIDYRHDVGDVVLFCYAYAFILRNRDINEMYMYVQRGTVYNSDINAMFVSGP